MMMTAIPNYHFPKMTSIVIDIQSYTF